MRIMRAGSGAIVPRVSVVTGEAIPTTLYRQLRRPLQHILIVTPFLQDYEFFGRGPLSKMLERQLIDGTTITLMTTAPVGGPSEFTRKYTLMELLVAKGVDVLFNDRLHAKIYLFDESDVTKACLLGSANLTNSAMDKLLEVAMFTHNRTIFKDVLTVFYKFRNEPDTIRFSRWKHEEAVTIKQKTEAT